jgi:hypothetical protein
MSDGIVPPFMDKEWRAMRARLRLTAAHAEAAAEASTLEDVESQTSLAYAELHRADYIREGIERKERKREDAG